MINSSGFSLLQANDKLKLRIFSNSANVVTGADGSLAMSDLKDISRLNF